MSVDPIVVAHDPAWADEFAALAAVLAPALGALAHRIHHVGSTSIPGLLAKPVLDIDIELAPRVPVAAATAALAPLGYEYQGDLGIADRFAYRRVSPAVPHCAQRAAWMGHHLYVCPFGSREVVRHLLFRERLRASAELRQEYVELKQECLRRAAGARQVYVDEKERLGDAFFRKVLEG